MNENERAREARRYARMAATGQTFTAAIRTPDGWWCDQPRNVAPKRTHTPEAS